jgi:Mrp family chromosome partitioning ATPase
VKKKNYKKAAMERYRILCNIIEKHKKYNVKCISLTSNSDFDGKTIIAKNLAMLLAKNGKKVLFIDCSLVDSVRVKSLDTNKTIGLISMLQVIYKEKTEGINIQNINEIQFKNYIIDSKFENLSILPLGVNSLDNHS